MSNVWNSADTKIPFHAALYLDLLWQIFLSNHLLFMGCFFPPRWRWGRSEGLLFLVSLCVFCWIHLPLKWSFYVQQFTAKTNRWNVKALFQVKVIWFSKCWTLFYFCCLRIWFNVLYSATIVVWCWSYILNLIQMSCKFDFFSYQDKVTSNFKNHF